jgi:hypothetical protein
MQIGRLRSRQCAKQKNPSKAFSDYVQGGPRFGLQAFMPLAEKHPSPWDQPYRLGVTTATKRRAVGD